MDGPYRYLNGTPAIPALYAARAGYEILLEIGVPAIREKSLRLTERILDRASVRGWKVWTPREAARRGGTVSLGIPDAPRVCEELARRGVVVDWRPEVGLRIGPHFYNTEDDVDRALAEIENIVTARR